jgi:hypothetical protein
MLAAYTDLLDGARGWYARREGDDSTAAYSAAMLLTFLLLTNVAFLILLTEVLTRGGLRLAPWIGAHRLVLLPIPVAVAMFHVVLAKRTGVYARCGPALRNESARRMKFYLIGTLCNILVTLVVLVTFTHFGGGYT